MTLLFFSRDPGPTNQLVAVHAAITGDAAACPPALRALREASAGLPIAVRGKPPGDQVWRRAGIDPQPWASAPDDDAIVAMLEAEGVRIVATGTSDIDEDTDRRLWRAARRIGADSHVFMDHPANLDRRFFEASGVPTFPDRVYVPDEAYLAPLAALGVPRAAMTVAGDLHLARLARGVAAGAAAARDSLRGAWGASAADVVVLYASECNAEMAAAGRPSAFDEFATLDRLIALVRARAPVAGVATAPATTLIVVRPHPRDRAGKYDAWRDTRAPRLVISAAGAPLEALYAADAIAGMDSTLLREAAALRRPVVSLTGVEIRA
ncbi:MAG: hypothetical protein JNK67_17275 [Alphaproteobacteria bacterium]|nr:hypothetical protein [Alphaproteobacteria bacterium]